MISISEIFASPNGEGSTTGLITLFVRVAGCNFSEEGHACEYCDTSFAWLVNSGRPYELKELESIIDKRMERYGLREICLTGGEPLWCNEAPMLINYLKKKYNVTVETNGSIAIWEDANVLWSLDIKCPSSGNDNFNLYSNLVLLKPEDQVKFIIEDRKDYDFSVDKLKLIGKCNIIFQPSHGKLSHEELIEWIKADNRVAGRVRIGTQCQKVWYPEKKRGV